MLSRKVSPFSDEIERIAQDVVDAAFKVHATLGPGLLESVYNKGFVNELRKRGRTVRDYVPVPIVYDDLAVSDAIEPDVLVEETIMVELKAVERMIPLFEAQLLSYMRLTGKRLGFLVNFNVVTMKQGIRRRVL